MKELGKLRPWFFCGLLLFGLVWRDAWWILGGLIALDWAGDRWRELLDAIRGKPETLIESATKSEAVERYEWTDSDDFVELWYAANETARERLRMRWRNQGLGMLANDSRIMKSLNGQVKRL